jgi:hypothetical protein
MTCDLEKPALIRLPFHIVMVLSLLAGPMSGHGATLVCRTVDVPRPDCCCAPAMQSCGSANTSRCECCEVEVTEETGRGGESSGAPLSDHSRFDRASFGMPIVVTMNWPEPSSQALCRVPENFVLSASTPRLHILHSILRC